MARIELLVGTVYGNAQDTAEYLQELLQAAGHQVNLDTDPQLEPLLTAPPDLLLVCTSTTGQGDLPDNIVPFFYQLKERFPLMPQQRFAVIGLGDASYDDTFGMGGKQFEELLLELQAQPAVASLTLDAASAEDPFEQTRRWSEQLLQAL
ncbi:flavodoxin domain-containing protein [Motiliproteus sediminis]|uniref:flavodoxin domain-containing protein n=1 Tax=Motiliproteus sediminis TaxID=1468178 RepID=UPI001AEF89AE|nr:flavodoxin domain-containing protein [Motiliproteus sediminis]